MPLADVCDAVELTEASGEVRKLRIADYDKLPLRERVAALMANRLKFYLRGQEISAREVVAAMNK